MRIPKHVNATWDWAERHGRVLGLTTMLVLTVVGALLLPALGALAAGILVGAVVMHRRMTRRLVRAKAENDELLRENGALAHEVTLLRKGILAEQSLATQQLPFIPESD